MKEKAVVQLGDGAFWAVLLLALAEGILVWKWARAGHRASWECGRAEARLALLQVQVLRMMRYHQEFCDSVSRIDIHGADEARRALDQSVEATRALLEEVLSSWHHRKRGTDYWLLARGIRLNMSGPVCDGDEVVLYVDKDTGKMSVREFREFMDGRFQRTDRRSLEYAG